eukprot:CAMPEP_0170496238 /NCGR_PEP_ID=MMETSP0208-20121228/20775_1 /TAXON_ID=197538 /ORGANISM="Strombidium inclinatum, Strain S3" /LENGTH=139 /DNA_ID=CAMNT_0010772725 /DNA_START=341 /DNA_END=761 /DNA_ORIENTATION=-
MTQDDKEGFKIQAKRDYEDYRRLLDIWEAKIKPEAPPALAERAHTEKAKLGQRPPQRALKLTNYYNEDVQTKMKDTLKPQAVRKTRGLTPLSSSMTNHQNRRLPNSPLRQRHNSETLILKTTVGSLKGLEPTSQARKLI